MFYSLAAIGFEEKELRFRLRSWQVNVGGRAPSTTILFIPFSAPPHKLETEWEKDCDKILQRCPVCQRESIIGHGRRRKQAHDQHHDWITIHRGRCAVCGKTFTFLPLFSLLYTHYSLLARCYAFRRRFVEHSSWGKASPMLKDSNPIPSASLTGLRRFLAKPANFPRPESEQRLAGYADHSASDGLSLVCAPPESRSS
jgi:hypothetical protein